ncbi:MAG: helix-turn-helix domain-containing protein [Kiloniellaceae bacterium]
MSRKPAENRCDLWGDAALPGVLLLRADFTSHEFSPHVHDEMVIAVTEQGGAEFDSRGVNDVAEKGATLVFNPGEPHAGRMGRSARWCYRAFYLDGRALERLAADLEVPRESLPGFCTNKLADPALSATLRNLHVATQGGGSVLGRQSALLAAMAELYRRHGSPRPRQAVPGQERSRIGRVADYLQAHYAEAVSLEDLAALAGMSAFHLVRSFKKELGLPPHVYLTQLRLQQARRLLAQGLGLAETAAAVGFYDQSALSRHFKKIYGVTPGQYARARAVI